MSSLLIYCEGEVHEHYVSIRGLRERSWTRFLIGLLNQSCSSSHYPKVLCSLRRAASTLAGAGGVAGGGAGAGDGWPSGSQRFWRYPRRREVRRRWAGPTGVPAGIQRPKAERSSVLRGADGPAGGWWGSGPDNLGRFRRRELAAQPAL